MNVIYSGVPKILYHYKTKHKIFLIIIRNVEWAFLDMHVWKVHSGGALDVFDTISVTEYVGGNDAS